jgi:hypothetical protein
MVNRAAYKGEKRQKEIARQKKQEEKRLRRHARSMGLNQEEDGADGEPGEAGDGAPAESPAKDA